MTTQKHLSFTVQCSVSQHTMDSVAFVGSRFVEVLDILELFRLVHGSTFHEAALADAA